MLCAEDTTHSASATTVGLIILLPLQLSQESYADDITIGFEHRDDHHGKGR